MIWGTSEIWSKSGPVDLRFITKMVQRIQEKYGIIFKHIFSYLNFLELRKFVKFGSTGPYFVLRFACRNSPHKKSGISERFQRIYDVARNLGIFGQSFFGNI